DHPQDLHDLFIRSGVATNNVSSNTGVVSGGSVVGTVGRPVIGGTPGASSAPVASAAAIASSNEPFSGGPPPSSTIFPDNQSPMRTLLRVEQTTAPITINHQGQFPVVTLSFNLAPGSSLGAAVNAVYKVKDELAMPASIQGEFQGAAAAFENALR